MSEPLYFASPAEFRDWLAQHAATATELIVGFHKVASGVPSMTWPQSVDEALCVGWIDGVRKSVDELRYQIRFTPRRAGSIWSAINIARVEALTAQGRMLPAGVAAFARREAHKSAVYLYELKGEPELPAAMKKRFKASKAAWTWFESQPPGWKRSTLRWVLTAKQEATRERRLEQLIEASAAGQRVRP
ncbi:MAG: YdeI/OmpD-associated family protein [Roseateles sp.]|uniref:YdeI/OmpD-associated family protein n=1 Tax=Roseateles sp. TaxID=1971397 RepID=UPI0040352615